MASSNSSWLRQDFAEEGLHEMARLSTKAWLRASGGVLLALTALPAMTAPITVFTEDFESGAVPSEISGAGSVVGTQGYGGLGYGANFLQNGTLPPVPTTITLSSLPAHSSIDLNFLLAIIDSWDGNDATFGPDFFNVAIDGATIFSETFSVFAPGGDSFVPDAGVALTEGTSLGFNAGFVDSAYDMGLQADFNAIPHTGSDLTIEFFASGAGFQGGTDESFALDNIEVVVNTDTETKVPAPTTMLLTGIGLIGLALRRRSKLDFTQ